MEGEKKGGKSWGKEATGKNQSRFFKIFFFFTSRMYNELLDSEGEGEGGMIWENGILTCILSCKNRIASLCLTQDAASLGLVHGDNPERCYGKGGGRGFHVWERM